MATQPTKRHQQQMNLQCSSLVTFIDHGLQSVYNKLGINYLNDDGVGIFAAFCILNGFDDAGNVLLTVNVKGGKIVPAYEVAVLPHMFFATYGKTFYGLSSKSPYLKQFFTHLTSFYPKDRAAKDLTRAIAAASGGSSSAHTAHTCGSGKTEVLNSKLILKIFKN